MENHWKEASNRATDEDDRGTARCLYRRSNSPREARPHTGMAQALWPMLLSLMPARCWPPRVTWGVRGHKQRSQGLQYLCASPFSEISGTCSTSKPQATLHSHHCPVILLPQTGPRVPSAIFSFPHPAWPLTHSSGTFPLSRESCQNCLLRSQAACCLVRQTSCLLWSLFFTLSLSVSVSALSLSLSPSFTLLEHVINK